MTDSQQNEIFDMSEIAALAAAKFGGVEFTNDKQPVVEKEDEHVVSAVPGESKTEEVHVEPAKNSDSEPVVPAKEPAVEKQEPAAEVKQPAEIDPFLKALLEQNAPKAEEKVEPVAEVKEPEVKAEPVKQEPTQPVQQQPQPTQIQPNKPVTPYDLLDANARKQLVEFNELDNQTFSVIDQIAGAHSRASSLNLEAAMVQVVQHMQAQLAQQNQIIAQLQGQLSGVNTRITAPTLDQDIAAMKSDPSVAAYLPYMQNVLNGNDSNAKMQLVNTWKQSKSQATAAPAVQTPVIERRTANVSAAAEATAALANKTQSSMVQPTDEIKEGMDLAAARFGPKR